MWLSYPVDPARLVFFHPAIHPFLPAGHVLKDVLLRVLIPALVLVPAIFGPAHAGRARRFLAAPFVAWVGLISYGVYLYHVPIIGIMRGSHFGIGPPPRLVADVGAVVVSLVAGALELPVGRAALPGDEAGLFAADVIELGGDRFLCIVSPARSTAPTVVLTFDNLGEAAELERGTWPAGRPRGRASLGHDRRSRGC